MRLWLQHEVDPNFAMMKCGRVDFSRTIESVQGLSLGQ